MFGGWSSAADVTISTLPGAVVTPPALRRLPTCTQIVIWQRHIASCRWYMVVVRMRLAFSVNIAIDA
jgi:hypothetical protein